MTLPGAPDDVYLPATHTYDQDVIVSWRAEGDERIEVRIDHSGAARAVRGAPEGFPERGTPMPELARRPVPALLAGLRGLDVAISEGTGELAARSDRWLTFCDTGAPRACLPPVEVAALGHAQGRLGRLFFRGDGTHEIGFQWSETGSGGALDSGSLALVLSGRDRPSLLVLATVHTQGSRTTRTSVGLEGTYHSTESTRWYAGCLLVAGTTVSRDLTTNTSERRLPSPRLSRAPDVVPATGVDPMAVSLDGHWILQEEGGLRRQSGRCPGERPEDSRQIPFH